MRSRIAGIFTVIALCALLIGNPFGSEDTDGGRGSLPGIATSPVSTPAPDPSVVSLRAVVPDLPDPPAIVELNRVQMASGAGQEIQVPGPALYWVEDGVLGIRVAGPAFRMEATGDGALEPREEATPGVDYTLRRGDSMLVMTQTPHILRNDARAPNSFISVLVFPGSAAIPSWLSDTSQSGSISIHPLASDIAQADADLPGGPAEITLTRAALARGESLTLPGLTLFGFLVVDEGTLTLNGGAEEAVRTHQTGEVIRLDSAVGMVARNEGEPPLVVFILEINPAPPETGSAG